MNCPACNKPLENVQYEGVTLDCCKGCGGFWLDQGELGKIVRCREETFSREEIDKVREMVRTHPMSGIADEERKIACPHCGKESLKTETQGITIDRCPEGAGIWLDKGELEMLQAAAEECSTVFTDEQKAYFRERAERNAPMPSLGMFDLLRLFFYDLFKI